MVRGTSSTTRVVRAAIHRAHSAQRSFTAAAAATQAGHAAPSRTRAHLLRTSHGLGTVTAVYTKFSTYSSIRISFESWYEFEYALAGARAGLTHVDYCLFGKDK
jgi:hypothetical protein